MVLQDKDIKAVISFVKQEPRTVQDIAKMLHKSWLTADSYVQQIKERTGLVEVKIFRKGTQGALKLVYYAYPDTLHADDLREELYHKIKNGRFRSDFDFMEIFQFIDDGKKKSSIEDTPAAYAKRMRAAYQGAQHNVYCFSGNLSFLRHSPALLDVWEDLLQKKVHIKIICRINLATLENINLLLPLLQKYPEYLEIKHSYHPLRGCIVDDTLAFFCDEEKLQMYREGELPKDTWILYELYDEEWIAWLQKVFWNIFRFSIGHDVRIKELKKIK
ncbi:MAG TPA: hypothetical protein VJI32_06430 [Candidatus Nanoarchaeia archaeon]|nr:hypothetical protein [Candidatus Nanoarchaeia archaeon]